MRALGSYSFSEYILLAGGVYPAFLARSLAALRRSSLNGSLTLTGTPQLTAGNKIELVGFGQLSGPWLITTARHAFDRNSGYTTELEVARGPVTRGKKQKTQKLTVYHPDGSTSTVIKEKKK